MAFQFINADLEIFSDEPLDALRDEFARFGDRFNEMYCGENGPGKFIARFEIHPEEGWVSEEAGASWHTASNLIQEFCTFIPKISPDAMNLWNRAERRAIDLGYDSDTNCPVFNDAIPSSVLFLMSELSIDLALSLYPETIDNDVDIQVT